MSDDVRLILGDCVAAMRGMEPASIDLILTSPPYDNLRRYASGSAFDFEALALECKRVLVPGGVLVWVVGDQTRDGDESGTSFRQALHFKAIGLKLRDTMIWRKGNPMPSGGQQSHYCGAFEYMFVFTHGDPNVVNLLDEPCKRAGSRQRCIGREQGVLTRGGATGKLTPETKRRSNVWEYGLNNTAFPGHPAVFPLRLAVDHVLSWTDEGDTVCDPFMGSGTTGEACLKTGRKFVGIEKAPEYFAIAEKRLAAAQAERSSMLPFASPA